MNITDNSSQEILERLEKAVSALEKRMAAVEEKLEKGTGISGQETTYPSKSNVTASASHGMDWENVTGASMLGWLAIIISLIGIGFFIRFMFMQKWITGWGQPITLGIVGAALIAVSDLLWIKMIRKFSVVLTATGYTVFFLALYWSSVFLSLANNNVLILGSLLLFGLSVYWGFRRDASLWVIFSFLGAGVMPLFIMNDNLFGKYILVYFNLLLTAGIAVSAIKDWKKMSVPGTITGNLLLIILIRQFFSSTETSNAFLLAIMASIPAFMILWPALVPVLNKRKPSKVEAVLWGINNLVAYIVYASLWSKLNAPYILLIPIVCNGVIYYFLRSNKDIDPGYKMPYLTTLVITGGIGLTVIIPLPFDIITLCLYAVFLAILGNKKHGFEYKALSGLIVVWSLFFLFLFRFDFASTGEIPFVNFRFISFAIAFLCYGYQGKMIKDDPSAGKIGPFLGQGLFSLGLIALLGGLSGEIIHLFPPKDDSLVSEEALLAISVSVAFFSFIVTYIGIVQKLLFLRLLALLMFLLLISKLIFIDIASLKPVFLIASLVVVGILLGGTSILLKKYSPGKKELTG